MRKEREEEGEKRLIKVIRNRDNRMLAKTGRIKVSYTFDFSHR